MNAIETAVCMGFDAMRLCLGVPTQNFTRAEVMRWLELIQQDPTSDKP